MIELDLCNETQSIFEENWDRKLLNAKTRDLPYFCKQFIKYKTVRALSLIWSHFHFIESVCFVNDCRSTWYTQRVFSIQILISFKASQPIFLWNHDRDLKRKGLHLVTLFENSSPLVNPWITNFRFKVRVTRYTHTLPVSLNY